MSYLGRGFRVQLFGEKGLETKTPNPVGHVQTLLEFRFVFNSLTLNPIVMIVIWGFRV